MRSRPSQRRCRNCDERGWCCLHSTGSLQETGQSEKGLTMTLHKGVSNCRTTLPLKGQGGHGHTSPPERELARKGHLEGSSDFQSAQGDLIARQQGDKHPNCIPSLPQLQGSWGKLILDIRGKRSHGCDLCG